MKRSLFIIGLLVLISANLVNSIPQEELNEAKKLIESGADCRNLSDSQLEIIGEYYMEQMHPGEAHELMHRMMGLEEGSDAEKQFHVNMANRIYCNENNGGMMNMMTGGSMRGYDMMGYGYGNTTWGWLWIIFWILVLVGVVLLIIWLTKNIGHTGIPPGESALDILKKRYAKGEISKEEFEGMKKEIGT